MNMLSLEPDVEMVIVSVPAEVVITTPSPATKVSVSEVESATTLSAPATTMVPNALIPVSADPLPLKKLPVTLPIAETCPAVTRLPPATLPVAVIVVDPVTAFQHWHYQTRILL